jgi:hypothetical protein
MDLHRILILYYVPILQLVDDTTNTYIESLHQKEFLCFEQELTLTIIYIIIHYNSEYHLSGFLRDVIDRPELRNHILNISLYDLTTPFYIVSCVERF